MKKIHMAGPSITEHEIRTVEDAMRNGWYENAYLYCEKFQNEFAAYHGRKYALMTPNCTTALHLVLTGLGVKANDEVIVPECTWIGSSAAIDYLGAKTVFCDIDAKHWCLDPASVERAITPKTRAIIAVDLFGNMPELDALLAISKKHGIPLVEDAAEAVGSTYKGKRAGSFGVASAFSFHRTKTLVTGEGGMLLTDDKELYERCSFWRDHGRRAGGPMYYNYAVTYKYMPFNVQAAIGYAQFQRVEELVGMKRAILERYRENLAGVDDIQLNAEPEGGVNGAWITGLVFGKSYELTKQIAIESLEAVGVPSRPFFYPLSSLPAYDGNEATYRPRNPTAYDISARAINLPGALNLTADQIDFVCEGLKQVLNGRRKLSRAG